MFIECYAAVNGTFELVVSIGDTRINTLVDDHIRQHPVEGTRVVLWHVKDIEMADEQDS